MSKSNEVYDLVIERLIHADFTFGDRLLVRELAEETGASRQPCTSSLKWGVRSSIPAAMKSGISSACSRCWKDC